MPAESARLVVADPPYYNVLSDCDWDTQWDCEEAYLEWTERWIDVAMRVLMPGGLLYCFGQLGKREHVFLHLMSESARNCQFHDLIIWDRAVGYNERGDSFTPAYEMLLVLRKEGPVYFNKDAVREPYPPRTIAQYSRDKRYKDPTARMAHLQKGKYATNLWRIPSLKGASREKVGHPSQKPEALIERIVRSSSGPGDLVIDPFLGSGTTAVIATRYGRRWIGIEREPRYAVMARRRVQKEKLALAQAEKERNEAQKASSKAKKVGEKTAKAASKQNAANQQNATIAELSTRKTAAAKNARPPRIMVPASPVPGTASPITVTPLSAIIEPRRNGAGKENGKSNDNGYDNGHRAGSENGNGATNGQHNGNGHAPEPRRKIRSDKAGL
jgi:site-specific DNA-methyltransferase (adenine-specific)